MRIVRLVRTFFQNPRAREGVRERLVSELRFQTQSRRDG